MYRIRKIFKFEAAHILDNSFSTECQNIHGHSFKLELILECPILNKDGMVMDFKLLKEKIYHWIDKLDHSIIINRSNMHKAGLSSTNKIYFVDFNPTAENMCGHLYYCFMRSFEYSYFNLIVRIHETESSYAEYSEEKL